MDDQATYLFPDPMITHEDGLLCVGGNLSVGTLVSAYSQGIFPWPQEGYPMLWFSPEKRGVLDFKDFYLGKSFQKFLRKTNFKVKFNTAFEEVINECAKQSRPNQAGTWINQEMTDAYIKLHQAGYAFSVETWELDSEKQEEKLVGGMYGVLVEQGCSGESMFFKKSNASKFALYHLVKKLEEMKMTWLDIQMVTDNLESFGGKYIDRKEFSQRLNKKEFKTLLFPRG